MAAKRPAQRVSNGTLNSRPTTGVASCAARRRSRWVGQEAALYWTEDEGRPARRRCGRP